MSPRPAPIRLVDELASAEVKSPLNHLEPVDARTLPQERVWAADFTRRRSFRQRNCSASSGTLLRCAHRPEGFWVRFRIPVEPAGAYRLALAFDAPSPECLELTIRDADRTRRIRLETAPANGRQVSATWFTGPYASEIFVHLRERQGVPVPCTLSVRSLEAFSLDLTSDQRLSLSRPETGPKIAVPGPLLPLGDAETVADPFASNYDEREALFAPAPTDLRFRLRVPRGSRLLFSYGLSRESKIGDEVGFQVLVSRLGEERTVWSRTLSLTAANWHWHEAEVDLEELWGQSVALTLRTRSPGDRGYALWGTPTLDVPRRPGDPPNVILIAVDTLRADRLSAYGYSQKTSPRLAELAGDGILFHDAISQSNSTVPSFASLFTGRIVPRHRLLTVHDTLAPDVPTLARVFRANGWSTKAILFKAALFGNMSRGFEVYSNVPRMNHRADQNLDRAVDWLARAGDRRFFLFLHFDDPHQPFTQPPEFLRPESESALRRFGLSLPMHLRLALRGCEPCRDGEGISDPLKDLVRDLYDEEIMYVDDRVGRFLDKLRDLGLYDDAIIVFVADHGETLWSHHDFYGHGGVNMHDELIRVPLIVKPPGGSPLPRGAVVAAQVRLFDLMPTLLELAGIDGSPLELDARSLLPLLRSGGASDDESRDSLSMSSSAAAFRSDGWKLIYPVGDGVASVGDRTFAMQSEELYDLGRDRGELRDVAEESPEVVASMRVRTAEYLMETVGGRYLVVLGEERGSEVRIQATCEPTCAWDRTAHLGLPRMRAESRAVALFEGSWKGPGIALLARFTAPQDARLKVAYEHRRGGETLRERVVSPETLSFEEGLLDRLAAERAGGIFVVEARDRTGAARGGQTTDIDRQREEALRTLGYIN